MKTYPVLNKDGTRSFAFEIENSYIALATVERLLSEVEDVVDVKPRKAFSKSSDVHVEFKYREQPYIVWEPYGDSSRYWIGPKDGDNGASDISNLEVVFKNYHPPFHRSLIGDVLTLRFITRFFRKQME